MSTAIINETSVQSDVSSSQQHHPDETGVLLHVNLANTTGTPNYDVTVRAKTRKGSVEIARAGSSLTSDGDYVFMLHPGITNTATNSGNDMEETFQLGLPSTWEVKVVASTADGSNNADITVDKAIIR